MSEEKTKEEQAINCVCLKCYKVNCKYRSNPREFCPENGPVDWKGRKLNERAEKA